MSTNADQSLAALTATEVAARVRGKQVSAQEVIAADINCPATTGGKPAKTYVHWLVATFLLSLTGLQSASAPCGLTDGRSPVGSQIVGLQFGEERVLGVARCITKVISIGNPPLWLHRPSLETVG